MATQTPKQSNPIKETFVFFAITLGICWLVLWGPLVMFRIPASSFVSNVRGPGWALGLMLLGGFMPSLVALALTWRSEGRAGLKCMGARMIQFKIPAGAGTWRRWHWFPSAQPVRSASTICSVILLTSPYS